LGFCIIVVISPSFKVRFKNKQLENSKTNY
jgi:hypothetical protein